MSEPADRPAEPTVVVGYPDVVASTRPDQGAAAMQRLPAQVRTVRRLLVACLALLVLLVGGLGAALAGTLSQMDELTAQVTALGEQLAAAPAQQAPVEQAPAPAAQEAPAAPAAPVKQLGAAPVLDSSVARPDGSDETGAMLIGDPNAENVVEVYVDYQCPFCQKWEAMIGTPLSEAAMRPGSGLLIKQYTMAFLGEKSASLTPAGASARAGNAVACVLHSDGAEVSVPFSASVFAAADPSEPPGQFTAEQLSALAEQAGASDGALACIESGDFVPFVAGTTQASFGRGVSGTPTVILNGRTLGNSFTDESLAPLVAAG